MEEDALSVSEQAKQIKNNHQQLNVNIITILQDLNRIDEAWTELRRLRATIGSSQEIRAVEASLLMKEENYAEASIVLQDLSQTNSHNARHWLN